MYCFNPIYNKVPCGPVEKNKTVTYTLKIKKEIKSTAVNFCYCCDFTNEKTSLPMQRFETENEVVYTVSAYFENPGLYWYHFEVHQGSHMFYLQKTTDFSSYTYLQSFYALNGHASDFLLFQKKQMFQA